MRQLLLTAASFAVLAVLSVPGEGLRAQESNQVQPTDQSGKPVPPKPVHGSIGLAAGSGQVVHLQAPSSSIITADPKVAEVRPASNNSVFVFGVAPGNTTVVALDSDGNTIAQYQVSVMPSDFDAHQALRAAKSGSMGVIRAQPTDNGVRLNGEVNSPADAEYAAEAGKSALPTDGKIDNRLRVAQPMQVSLHVRIAEMTRTMTRELGVNWAALGTLGKDVGFGILNNNAQSISGQTLSQVALGGSSCNGAVQTMNAAAGVANANGQILLPACNRSGYNISSVIEALAQDGLVHTLAEPNLTTMSGEPASFLVGGEFPIPIATQMNTISLQFKQYGISLNFVPTVVSRDHILLHVRPEVSALDPADGVPLAGLNGNPIVVPALTVRRADTTVDLGSGQSFAIAGLLSDQTKQTTQGLPGLGEMPILGPLFRSDEFQRQQTELVIIVTPYLVRPVSDPTALKLPTDGYRPPNDIERVIWLREQGTGMLTPPRARIAADAGFVIE